MIKSKNTSKASKPVAKPKLVTSPAPKEENKINLPNGFYKIVEGMAIPTKQRLSNIETKYAFLKDLGISKDVNGVMTGPCVHLKDKALWASCLNAANNYGRKKDVNKTFIARVLPDGYGIWRIK